MMYLMYELKKRRLFVVLPNDSNHDIVLYIRAMNRLIDKVRKRD